MIRRRRRLVYVHWRTVLSRAFPASSLQCPLQLFPFETQKVIAVDKQDEKVDSAEDIQGASNRVCIYLTVYQAEGNAILI